MFQYVIFLFNLVAENAHSFIKHRNRAVIVGHPIYELPLFMEQLSQLIKHRLAAAVWFR